MREKKTEGNVKEEAGKRELSLEELEQASGGTMRGNIVKSKTTDISEDTRKNI